VWGGGGGGGAVLLISRHWIVFGFISLFFGFVCLGVCVCGVVLCFAWYSRKTKYYHFFELEFKPRKQYHSE
jgi:uncharacterized SAM-binding protein YcdF (DUF218 family)